jgi:hypothetical protein
VTADTDIITLILYTTVERKRRNTMTITGYGNTALYGAKEQAEFEMEVKKLKARAKHRPYNMIVHRKLEGLYLSRNMFPEAESEQEILEWLCRIKRNVNL